ncbi:MAG TPA: hypothetical protein VFE27_17330 [Acidobacteriaceae bacterium]|nr:hypothetical protein [Acidobacteriaceae bacterium]
MASSRYFVGWVPFCRTSVAVVLLGLLPGSAFAKTPELSAIEVYPTGDAHGYVQISGFTLNAKNEVHICTGVQSIGKNSYGKLPKITLAPGMSLERAKDGMLLLTRGGAPECVVPANLKLEKDEGATPSELADKTDLQGQIVGKSISSTDTIPRVVPGVKIVFVSTLDTELAEFLLAQSSANIAGWKAYLGKYPAGPHSGEAKAALAVLYVRDGQSDLAAYQASLKDNKPNYGKLQAAEVALDAAMASALSNDVTEALAKGINGETKNLNSKGLGEIALYRDALAKQAGGYPHLLAAEKISQLTLGLDPKSAETASLSHACVQERTNLDHHLVDFANKLSARRPDEAYEAIKPLCGFATEYPKVQDSLHALYSYHVEQGKKDAGKSDFQGEVDEFQKAAVIESTPEIAELLRNAQQQLQETTDKAAITSASTMSASAEDDKDFVKAYEVLADLTPSQQKAVAERLDSLKDRYVQAASLRAKDLERINTPVKGVANEQGIQRAYYLLSRCHALTNDPGIEDRIAILGGRLSDYYLAQAKHYLDRPDGTGANVGWAYLEEALQYNRTDASAIHDAMTLANPAHQLRSRLSLRVTFRDRTSRMEAVDFASQLTDSLAAGLESSSLNIKVVRPNETTPVKPNFLLVGDVLQNTHSDSVERTAKESKYRSGEQDQVNDDWNAADREYESANLALQTDQRALEGAEVRGKKGAIEDAKRQAAEAQKKVEATRIKLDSLQKFRHVVIERPYTYTEQINHLKATVELGFVIQDTTENVIVPNVQINETQEKPFTVLENVKADDTMGVRSEGEVPSETQFLERVEYSARDRLLTQAKEKIIGLPPLILQTADRKASEADNDGAAELYMLYLNSTASQATPERKRAQKFLLDNYNFRAYGESPKS